MLSLICLKTLYAKSLCCCCILYKLLGPQTSTAQDFFDGRSARSTFLNKVPYRLINNLRDVKIDLDVLYSFAAPPRD